MTSTATLPGHAPAAAGEAVVATDIPARLDRLRWGRFHTLVVVALGITWILDGLEVTLAGAVAPALKESPQLQFSNAEVGLVSSAYLAGAVLGALFFGWLTDRLGRKRLFFITLALYLFATAATALSWDLWSFALFRFLTGAGIGGEYTAINSAIQELIPARYRGWTDLVINGSFWIGAAVGAVASIILLDPAVLPPDMGWRLAFLIGATLGLVIFLMRMWLPEQLGPVLFQQDGFRIIGRVGHGRLNLLVELGIGPAPARGERLEASDRHQPRRDRRATLKAVGLAPHIEKHLAQEILG